MPRAANVKIKLVHKVYRQRSLVIASVILLGLIALFIVLKHNTMKYRLSIHGKTYHLLLAETSAAQEKGLGDRASLAINEGMLFTFTNEAVRCFWMKDMNFSIDMIWLNEQKQIVYIQPNVSPDTYPEVFCPSTPASYVLELNAGQAAATKMETGQTLNF